MTTQVKICGITRPEDAALAVERGAWAIGLILWPGSPRPCDPERAAEIADRPPAPAPRSSACSSTRRSTRSPTLADELGLTIVQLHGDEGPPFCDEVARRTGVKVIKAVRVRDRCGAERHGAAFRTDFHLLDAYEAGCAAAPARPSTGSSLAEPTPRRARR